ncbi:MAG: TonB family protein [Terriglobales bacterium]
MEKENRWQQWEGRSIDGKFLLGNYLGGTDGCGVFRARVVEGRGGDHRLRIEEEPTGLAIKLADVADAESQLRQWKAVSELTHPNLIRILAVGRIALEDADGRRELVYAVEELAEENLAQILPERALTPEEARGMLGPVLGALELVHGKGLVHGRIRPSNILAAGDQVKLSSDSLRRAGEIPRRPTSPTGPLPATSALYDAPEVLTAGISPASDVWSLGITLVEVLTQRVPAWDPARMEMSGPALADDIPEPFRGIARCCLQVDPAMRCGVLEIANRLEGRLAGKPAPAAAAPVGPIEAAPKKTAKGPYLLVLVAAIVVAIFLIVRPRPSSGPSEGQTSSTPPQTSSLMPPGQTTPVEQPTAQSPSTGVQQPPAPTGAGQTSPAQEETKPSGSEAAGAAEPSGMQKAAAGEIVEQAMPQVSAGAQRTIHGKIKVRVRVQVDAAGNVTDARLKEAGSSRYFARAALEAAKRWKFAPAHDENRRAWTLLFGFTRTRIETSATRAH